MAVQLRAILFSRGVELTPGSTRLSVSETMLSVFFDTPLPDLICLLDRVSPPLFSGDACTPRASELFIVALACVQP